MYNVYTKYVKFEEICKRFTNKIVARQWLLTFGVLGAIGA